MGLGEADTRAKLIDPAIHARGWTVDFIRREETARSVEQLLGALLRRALAERFEKRYDSA